MKTTILPSDRATKPAITYPALFKYTSDLDSGRTGSIILVQLKGESGTCLHCPKDPGQAGLIWVKRDWEERLQHLPGKTVIEFDSGE